MALQLEVGNLNGWFFKEERKGNPDRNPSN
jgi:hypothetical protein